MSPSIARSLRVCVAAGLVLAWLYAGTLTWRLEREQYSLIELVPGANVDRSLQQVRQLLAQSHYVSEPIEMLLRQVLQSRPLYAPAWLEMSELARRNGQTQKAADYLDYARSLWPQRPNFLWRVVLLLVSLEQPRAALSALASYWAAAPADGIQVIALARRLQPTTELWVDTLLTQAEAQSGSDAKRYYQQLLDASWRLADIGLAHTIWARVPEPARRNRELLFYYLDTLLAGRDYAGAQQAWIEFSGSTDQLYNGGFEQALLNGGFGWRYQQGSGFRIQQDRLEPHSGEYSLLVDFNGDENVNFAHLSQRQIVAGEQRVRLVGYWRGYNITTRSGVYMEISVLDADPHMSIALEPRYGSWPWERFELSLELPAQSHLIEVQLRRRATNALDKRIAGKVWLDDLSITAENLQ